MILVDLRKAIASKISTGLPGAFKASTTMDGPASLEELLRRSARSPSLFVNLPSDQVVGFKGGVATVAVACEVYVFVQATATETRGEAILRLSEAVRAFVAKNPKWEQGEEGRPENVRRRSLYTTALDQTSGALAVVTWTQNFADTGELPVLQDFEHLHLELGVVSGKPAPIDPSLEIDDIPIPPEGP